MKTKTYIFLFFLIISNFGFGQDSLLVVKDTVKFNPNILQGVQGLPFPKTKIDTTTFYDTKIVNSYILNKSEKDSIYKSYIKKNRKFLKPYRKDWKQLILTKYPDYPHLRNLLFFCLMNTNKIDNDSKQQMFIEKFRKDWSYCYRTDCTTPRKYDESKIYYSSRKGMPYRVKREKRTHYVHSKQIAINGLVGKIESWHSNNLYKLRPYIFLEVENDDFSIKNYTIDNNFEIHNFKEKIVDIEILGLEILDKEEVEKLLNLQLQTEKNLIIYHKKKTSQ